MKRMAILAATAAVLCAGGAAVAETVTLNATSSALGFVTDASKDYVVTGTRAQGDWGFYNSDSTGSKTFNVTFKDLNLTHGDWAASLHLCEGSGNPSGGTVVHLDIEGIVSIQSHNHATMKLNKNTSSSTTVYIGSVNGGTYTLSRYDSNASPVIEMYATSTFELEPWANVKSMKVQSTSYGTFADFIAAAKTKGPAVIEFNAKAVGCTVTLDPNGGTGGTASVTATYGAAMPAAAMPSWAGHAFLGYFDAATGGTKYYNADGSSAKNWDKDAAATLYAQWRVMSVAQDPTSGYRPTQIVNGGFAEEPWMDFLYGGVRYTINNKSPSTWVTIVESYPNGVDQGWNTTETMAWQSLFEGHNPPQNYGIPSETTHGRFIEMNNANCAVLWQDLTTRGGDIILWSLRHGFRKNSGQQTMRVEIGAPNGVATGIGTAVNANIKPETKATYLASGVTNPEGATYGYAAELDNLALPSTTSPDWYDVSGVYIIPEGQGVTRFAFTAITPTNGNGNLLDDLTFSTIVGNLKAVANPDGSVMVTGYWGDADATKKLCVQIGDGMIGLDMSAVRDQNFTVTLPADQLAGVGQIEVYHQDYPTARRAVRICHPDQFTVVADGQTFRAWCTNTEHTVAGGCAHAGEANAVAIALVANSAPFTGDPYDRAHLVGATNEWAGEELALPTIAYAVRGSSDYGAEPPSAVGLYTAKATLGELSVSADFEIMTIMAGEFEHAEGGLVKLPVAVVGTMTMYSISVDGAKLRVPAASGEGWRFKDAVIDVKTADATPVPGKNYVSVTLIVDPSAIGARKVSEVVEEVLESMRYTKAVAEVKITGTCLGDVALREGDYFLNGHFYTLSPACQTWNEAMQWAFNLMTSDADRYHGFKSYPVAITTHEENDLLVNIWANSHSHKTQVWLPAIPKNITGGTITVEGTDGSRTVTVTGIPYAAEDDSWSRNGIKGSGGLYGMGERYVWMPGIPEADLPLPAETNSYGSNGYYWSSGNPENRGICYFGHPELGALWDDLGPEQWGSNPKNVWTSFKTNNSTFHLYGLAEWEPINPDAVVTVSDTAKMVPITFSANAVDVTRGGSSFASTNSLVTCGVMPTVPALSGSDLVFLGWSESAAATAPTYVTAAEIAAIAPALGTAGVNLYAVWGAEVGIPVKVALDDCSTLPADGRTYTFKLNALDSFTPMPATNLVELALPTARGEENAVGYDAEDPANPWRTLYPRGDYYYHVSQLTDGAHPGEKLDAGYWEVKLTVNPSETPRWQMTSAIYYGAVADMDENSFHIIKAIESGTYATEAAVSVEGGKTKLTLGGGTVVSVSGQEEFNTAVLKSKFEVDFTRNFRAVGSFTPPPQTIPDGTCVGFMPSDAIPTSAEVNSCGGGSLGYISNTKFVKALVLDFDPYNNGSTYGDPGYTHFTLTETGSDGFPIYGTAQHKNVASKWPTAATQYSIEYDAETKKLVFTVKLPSGDLVYNYNDPAAYFGKTTAYLFMSGVVRRGPANQYGLGSVGSPAPSLTMYFDSFNYLGQRTGYDSIPVLFVNRQEAKIVYNAWGGLFAGGEETYEAFAEDAIPPAPDVTRAGNYELEGWFTGWTNGAERIETGVKLDPVVDRELYAKWTSKALPKEEEEPADEKTLDHEPTPDGSGEVLKGANKALTETDLAIPEFTSNGPDGVPYVIIERGAFTRENYDKQRERELIKAGASDEEALAKDLTSVTISTYVTNIQSYAFSGCQQLTNVTFSKTRDYVTGCKADLYIDDWAFQDSSVRTVVFPADSRVVLDYGAFADADYLEKIVFLGDVELTAKYPFVGAGKRTDGPVTIQLSAKNAADPTFVASLTNGMSAASTRIVIDQETIWGEIEPQTFGVSGQTVTLTFKVPADSPWQTVTPDTLYGFYATTPDHVVVGTGTVVHPATLTGPDADGVYTATFTLPAEAVSGFFKFCIGEPQDPAAPAQEIHVQPIGPSPMNW